ncbi:MAG: type IX secretion system membrane protein PorP/SprF [Lewinellaceae bacterium]|nr:type IX secretion system membrane protein PorP/SprF [Lewinellaceae bacterium]
MRLGYDTKALRLGNNLLSAGLLLQHDQAGDAALRWTQLGGLLSAAHALGKSGSLSVGFGVTAIQRSFNIDQLTFKNQWDGDLFNASLPSGEQFNRSSGIQSSVSAGLNWHYENEETPRNTINLGGALLHLNRPSINFSDDAQYQMPARITGAAAATWMINDVADVVGQLQFQRMGVNQEMVAATGVRYWLDETALRLTMGWRVGDAIIPAFQLERGSWIAGLSYDWNISKFDIATQNKGGFEIGLV